MIRSYNERKLRQGKKKQVFLFFILLSYKSKKIVYSPQYFLLFNFLPHYCVPSDYFVKEELMIANYYIIK